MATHNISRATSTFMGDCYYERYHTQQFSDAKSGLPVDATIYCGLSNPLAAVTTALINSATGAQLPNTNTITYTTATSGAAPLNSGSIPTVASVVMADGTTQSVWVLDVPRALTSTATHGSSVVAMTMIVTGYDVYGEAMTELHTYTATGTSKPSSTGTKKAFKYIKSYAITAAADATANTLIVGFGNVLGLPFRLTSKDKVVAFGAGAVDASATIVIADDTNPATNVTGDVRGTISPNSAPDGVKLYAAWMLADRTQNSTATVRGAANSFGMTQA